ncbi:MAG: Wzz/FepE/Etk N-terminal domain-containing protein [Aeromonas veronii]|uniref:Wzz/FepE/Etk N-terminal domain-containing protein n=1 Tax=Aeromonas veronii TaxID=654 RepID=UPI0038D2A9FD
MNNSSNKYNGSKIDMQFLIRHIWSNKVTVFLVTLLMFIIGVCYATFAPEIWTSRAIIDMPKKQDTFVLDQLRGQLKLYNLDGIPNDQELYTNFILEFNTYNNIREFLRSYKPFTTYVNEKSLDDTAQQRLLRTWSSSISATPYDTKNNKPGIILSASSSTSAQSFDLLNKYIKFILAKQKKDLIAVIEQNRSVNIKTLESMYRLKFEDAKIYLENEKENIENSIKVATAANVDKPLLNFNQNDRFPITLGKDALSEKLKILESMDVEKYSPELMELKKSISRLKGIKIPELDFRSFTYLDDANQPLNKDAPKRTVIIGLSIIFGVMLGVLTSLFQTMFSIYRRPKTMVSPNLANIA